MQSEQIFAEARRLSVAERIQLVRDIWDTIAAHPEELPVTDTQTEELQRRLDRMEQNPREGTTWPELKAMMPGKHVCNANA